MSDSKEEIKTPLQDLIDTEIGKLDKMYLSFASSEIGKEVLENAKNEIQNINDMEVAYDQMLLKL